MLVRSPMIGTPRATAASIAGQDYIYAFRGDGRTPYTWVPAAQQKAALDALMGTLALDASVLSGFGAQAAALFGAWTVSTLVAYGVVGLTAGASVPDSLLQPIIDVNRNIYQVDAFSARERAAISGITLGNQRQHAMAQEVAVEGDVRIARMELLNDGGSGFG